MGFTRYWERTDKQFTQPFIDDVKAIIREGKKYGIKIRSWTGKGNWAVNDKYIAFNGDAATGNDYESVVIKNVNTDEYSLQHDGFGFCKTAREPYDAVVSAVFRRAEYYGIVKDVSDDGPNPETDDIADKIYAHLFGGES